MKIFVTRGRTLFLTLHMIIENRSRLLSHCVLNRISKKIHETMMKFSGHHSTLKYVKFNNIREVTSDLINFGVLKGINYIRDPRINKGLAFTLEERMALGIHGLQPPRIKTQEEQVALCRELVLSYKQDLNKYCYLAELQERNERLFFRLLSENIELLLPIVYTPTVGLACQKYGLIYRRPRGLFITIHDKGHIFDILENWPERDVRAICVTDGERILGLGDLGAYGMGIPIGKLSLYTALAGIQPHHCLPITIDVGTDNITLRNDQHYIGLNKPRSRGIEYEEFLNEFMSACVRKYGQNVLIQFEDFGNSNAFYFLDKYRDKYCTFNDDIQGTAAMAVAGIFASQRLTKLNLKDNKILFYGAGGAAMGIAELCVKAMVQDGMDDIDARQNIWMMDVDGLLVIGREDCASGRRLSYAKPYDSEKSLLDVVTKIKPTILIGASTSSGAFTPAVLKQMALNTPRPLIFALSNPTSKAECTPQQAYEHTDGKCIYASGSPFDDVTYNGKVYKPGQGNNAYIFPGVAMGIIATKTYYITEEHFLISARTVADLVTNEHLESGSVYPPLHMLRDCAMNIAVKITEHAFRMRGVNIEYPEPKDKYAFIKSKMYDYSYKNHTPTSYMWPTIDASPRRQY